MENVIELDFDKGSPLYKYIATFAIGLISLVSLNDERVRNAIKYLPGIEMKASVRQHVSIDLKVFQPWLDNLHVAANQEYLVNYTIWICEKAVSTAYEAVKSRNDKTPMFEFFRHIRNGFSHGNKFTFKSNKETKKELPRPAHWRGKTINRALEGSQVLPGFMEPGDIILLLYDMNEYLVKMNST